MLIMSKFAAVNAALRDRFWPVYLYLIASTVLTLSALFRGEMHAALCLCGTSFISLIAAGGLKFGILRGDKAQRVGVPIIALVLFAFAYWLSNGFSVQLFGYNLSGLTWGAIGALIGIAFIDQRPANHRGQASLHSGEVPQQPLKASDEKIVSDLAELMAKGDIRPDAFYDVSVLPHPKDDILLAIEGEIIREPSHARVELLAAGAAFLPSFQQGIGFKPLCWLGVDLAELQRSTPNVKEQAKILAQSPDRERAERFLAVMKNESAQIQTRIDAAVRARKARMTHSSLATADTNAEAQFKMGNRCIGDNDYAEAAKWYRKAAEQGYAMAQSQLGLMYYVGEGVPQDFAEAARWCRVAAETGITEAQCRLGDMHIKGQGVSQDYVEAAKWCRKAADKGHATAQMLLGTLYHNGQGVPRDYELAMTWLTLAFAGFSPGTKQRETSTSLCKLVASKMTEPQIARAVQLAREWRPT
jgi:tetratricopeptide (TPR) repeat protein